ncbi:hypothetical protein D0Z08_20710 [Nocardioides immobilis]|uniref:Condensation domain-containing protein n=1 Tax=Nocardioides immobilis TaxID=2049295 RepID=A0A417XX86_9ACTN|nr:hypothetical protein [Nocardioides immobilis]RHW25119.1 hypothetical protein D0Z08_20710 [Nocardioides immobilis]
MTAAGRWVADPTIGWRILLTATLPEAPGIPADRTAATAAELRRALVMPAPEPVLVGVAGRDLVVSAHHSTVDGLGLLRILEQLGYGPATSAARGVGDRPAGHGYVGTVARRLAEAAFRRPAAIPPPRTGAPVAGDTMVEAEVPGSVRTAEIIHAAGRAVAALGARRHVAVAVGARRAAVGDDLQDRSVLLRLRDVELLDLAGIERALREAPVERPPVSRSGAVDRVAAAGMRVLARRLGSTLLVSHLGEVTAPQVDRIAFHPVTAGGTGISLGAVGHRGRTVISLRARASDWDADGLERVLEAVVGRLVD